jgi:hypothetical protein
MIWDRERIRLIAARRCHIIRCWSEDILTKLDSGVLEQVFADSGNPGLTFP